MQHPLTARREAQPTGVIETLSAGYAALNRQLWVLLLPVLQGAAQGPAFTYRKVMIPVRDGVRLETVIAAPAGQTGRT